MRRFLPIITLVCLTLAACGDETAVLAPIVALEMTPEASLAAIGESRQFEVVGIDADGQRRAVEGVVWSSAAPESLQVSEGVVVGVAPGEGVVSAALGNLRATATVAVTPERVMALGLTPETPTIYVGESVHLTVTATFADDTSQYVTPFVAWSNAEPGVASVTRARVVGVSPGEVDLTARIGEVSGSIRVRVLAP